MIQKLPETNSKNGEKIADDTSNMAPTASTSAVTEVGLRFFVITYIHGLRRPNEAFFH